MLKLRLFDCQNDNIKRVTDKSKQSVKDICNTELTRIHKHSKNIEKWARDVTGQYTKEEI